MASLQIEAQRTAKINDIEDDPEDEDEDEDDPSLEDEDEPFLQQVYFGPREDLEI